MSNYFWGCIVFAVSALLSGIFYDVGFIGLSVGFGCICTLSFSVLIFLYLDSGTKFIDVDNARRNHK